MPKLSQVIPFDCAKFIFHLGKGYLPLHVAVYFGQLSKVMEVLNKNPNAINFVTREGTTPLDIALKLKDAPDKPDIIFYLRECQGRTGQEIRQIYRDAERAKHQDQAEISETEESEEENSSFISESSSGQLTDSNEQDELLVKKKHFRSR